jgi:hypothetical protein
MFANESSEYSFGSFDMMAIEPIPCAPRSLQSRTMRSSTAFTYGQWLQMNITSRPLGPRALAAEWRLPSTPGRSKSTAFQPKLQTDDGVATMRES